MSDLLALARDYIERMANPAYGLAENEDHSFRFARLLESEGFEDQLRTALSQLREPDTLTSYGWLWLIGWAKSKEVPLSEDLLLQLFDEWSSVFVKSEIIDLATQNDDAQSSLETPLSVSDFPNGFLARVLVSATQPPPDEESSTRTRRGEIREGEIRERSRGQGRAESLLIALLQVGRPITLRAASVLMYQKWEGQRRLLEFFWAITDLLDAETREVWIDRLHPPPRLGDLRE